MKIEIDNCYNMDCAEGMRLMKEQGIKANWCITDPPYGIEIEKMGFVKSGAKVIGKAQRKDYTATGDWDKQRIEGEYFDLMFDRSDNQIIFGGIIILIYYRPQKVGWYGTKGCPQKQTEMTTLTVKWRGVPKVWQGLSTICITECCKMICLTKNFVSTPHRNQAKCGAKFLLFTPKKTTSFLTHSQVLKVCVLLVIR